MRTNQIENKDDDIEFIIDTVDDSRIQNEFTENHNFVAFEETDIDKEVQLRGDGGKRLVEGRGQLIFDFATGQIVEM